MDFRGVDCEATFGSSGRFGRLVRKRNRRSCLNLLCVTGIIAWWPGVKYWRRSLTVSWGANIARIAWDLHSALGFWCFFFVLLLGVSGIYFAFPQLFAALLFLDPSDKGL